MSFSNVNSNCSDLLDMRNLQEQLKKAFCNTKNCSSDRKKNCNLRLKAENLQKNSLSLEHLFLTVDKNNFSNKIPFWHDQSGLV